MTTSKLFLAATFAWLLLSFWKRNDLPGEIDYVDEVLNEPTQNASSKSAFDASFGGVNYRVEPEFDYELYGMVVSFRHHDGQSRMHRQSNDHLNMLDVCVIWGDNIANPHLGKINFWNGIFTCNFQTRDQAAWDAFDIYQVSNNHLISDDNSIRDRVKSIRIGDQIRIRGHLASYASEGGGERGTSTTRMDTGDGACETIYVEKFEIVAAATSYWRLSMYAALLLLAGGLIIGFRKPYRPYRNH